MPRKTIITEMTLYGTTLDAYYDQETICCFEGQSSSELFSTSTDFSLPAADYAGQCNDFNFVTFENNIEELQLLSSASFTTMRIVR